jgi:hypothetical protein
MTLIIQIPTLLYGVKRIAVFKNLIASFMEHDYQVAKAQLLTWTKLADAHLANSL